MAELADAQRSGRCLVYPSTGSTPASGIKLSENTGILSNSVLDREWLFYLGHFFCLHVSLRTTNGKNAII